MLGRVTTQEANAPLLGCAITNRTASQAPPNLIRTLDSVWKKTGITLYSVFVVFQELFIYVITLEDLVWVKGTSANLFVTPAGAPTELLSTLGSSFLTGTRRLFPVELAVSVVNYLYM